MASLTSLGVCKADSVSEDALQAANLLWTGVGDRARMDACCGMGPGAVRSLFGELSPERGGQL